VEVARDGATDEELSALIAATTTKHLTTEETAIVGHSPKAQTLDESARFAATALATAAGGDVGFIGHTTFGTGLPAGDVTKYVFDSVVRFDGKLVTAEVDRKTLDDILTRCNQDGDIPLAARTGDFLYAAPLGLADKPTYKLVTNDWSATNQKSYFGREDLKFTDVEPALAVKATVVAALE
jgi:2',3'-cyclic-nucleotide 2'-phosphodiesterase (5'-nucleotidase family)